MSKRAYFVLTTLVGIGAVIWLARDHKIVRAGPTAPRQIRTTTDPTRQASHLPEGRPAGTEVPESKRQRAESAALDQAILNQEAKVEERRKVLATIVRTKGIIYKGQDASYSQPGAAKNALEAHDEFLGEKRQLESQINSLLKYDNEQLIMYAAGLDLPENSIKVLYPQYLEAKRKLEDIHPKGLGEKHPTRVTQVEQTQAILHQLDEGVVNLRVTLQAKLDTATEAIKRGLDAQNYVDAKRDFETNQQLLDAMKQKQIKEKSGR